MTRIRPLGLVLAVPAATALVLPFMGVRPNRIAMAEMISLHSVIGIGGMTLAFGVVAALLLIRDPRLRGVLAGAALCLWVVGLGVAASALSTQAGAAARAAPSTGFWVGFAALGLFVMDAVARLQPGPTLRLGLLGAVAALMAAALGSGVLGSVSILQEYDARRAVFWTETGRHLALAFGSFLVAIGVGVPLGILCQRWARAGGGVLGCLTLIQTIPSIALFGILILPLGWIAGHVPGARALGISGIGMTPAFVALFLYALLPVVSNTVAGLNAVPAAVTEAARGMGFTNATRLRQVDLPLALPVILAGARIVLVQGIGLATVGALIGAGGFGTFVFQGLGQTAPDLILLGALPTVALAFAASVVLGALIDFSKGIR